MTEKSCSQLARFSYPALFCIAQSYEGTKKSRDHLNLVPTTEEVSSLIESARVSRGSVEESMPETPFDDFVFCQFCLLIFIGYTASVLFGYLSCNCAGVLSARGPAWV